MMPFVTPTSMLAFGEDLERLPVLYSHSWLSVGLLGLETSYQSSNLFNIYSKE